jgi:hypothetical protein
MPPQVAKIIKYFVSILCFTMLPSCKSLYDFKGYLKSNAKGAISGSEWAYSYAYTDPEAELPEGQQFMIVLVSAKPKNACPDKSEQIGDGREAIISIDGKLGEMKIAARSARLETEDDMFEQVKQQRQASAAFFDPSLPQSEQYKFARSGKIKITKLTSEFIEGSIVAKVSRSMFINGKFRAKVCKYGQLN